MKLKRASDGITYYDDLCATLNTELYACLEGTVCDTLRNKASNNAIKLIISIIFCEHL